MKVTMFGDGNPPQRKPHPFLVHVRGLRMRVIGGPIEHASEFDAYSVSLAPEKRFKADHVVHVEDFGVPTVADVRRALYHVLRASFRGRDVYIGCGWGQGRTGLLIACLLKLFIEETEDPVALTRKVYRPQAVETAQQRVFVEQFTPGWLLSSWLVARLFVRWSVRL